MVTKPNSTGKTRGWNVSPEKKNWNEIYILYMYNSALSVFPSWSSVSFMLLQHKQHKHSKTFPGKSCPGASVTINQFAYCWYLLHNDDDDDDPRTNILRYCTASHVVFCLQSTLFDLLWAAFSNVNPFFARTPRAIDRMLKERSRLGLRASEIGNNTQVGAMSATSFCNAEARFLWVWLPFILII